jgi:isoleucyl-tRNA synthetase
VNVKELIIVPAEQSEIRLVKKIKPNFKVLGKKVGANMKALAAAISAMSQEDIEKMEKEGTFNFELSTSLNSQPSTLNYTLIPEDVEILTEDMPGWLVANNGILTVALDIELTDELIEEGIARELINRIQNLRKSSGLEITDRIEIELEDRPEIHNAVLHCGEYIASQVLATKLSLTTNDQLPSTIEMDGYNVNINIKKA